MAGWHHWCNRHEPSQILGYGEGQGGLACCGSWGHKESDMTEQLNWTIYTSLVILHYIILLYIFFCNGNICVVTILVLLFSHPVVSNSLQPQGLQHARSPCASSPPEVCPSSCLLHQWCHPAISSSVSLSPPAPNPSQLLISISLLKFQISNPPGDAA